ncbi:tripartite tricarboxylate transporter substrate binding protein [Paraglaciecola sp. 20A4]|uniref:tripartite tricarboxylate transporter substrate binding protein n=1 Tax=Paraglaciecola sp. 20A4 TaxID=2687288 RepID=UPI001408E8DF|nr:tripartite tricarboxylate transporter substrate binding protein [Paraglaciecola sp. 20A4]
MLRTLLISLLFFLFISDEADAQQAYPKRPITTTVVWSAGGGTDAVNRVIMAEMSKELGVRINVTNKAGGVSGSIGMSSTLRKRPDGYNLVGLASSNVSAAVNGGWREKFDVWYPFIVGSSPDVLSVKADSPYHSLAELVAAAKKSPGSLRASAGGLGSNHHLHLLELSKIADIDLSFIPYSGSAPSQTAAITGEVDLVITSMAEQAQLIRGNKLRPLAMLHPEPFEMLDGIKVPSAFIEFPELSKNLPISQAIGFAVNNKASAVVKRQLADAFNKAMDSSEVKDWARLNYYQLDGLYGEPAQQEFSRLESLFAWSLEALNANKVSPESLNISRPN